MPGVQKPHCRPCLFQNASCSGCSVPFGGARPSIVVTSRAVDLDREAGARLDGDAVEEHRAGAALARVAADLGAGHAAEIANEVHEQCARLDLAVETAAVDGNADADGHGPPPGTNDRT